MMGIFNFSDKKDSSNKITKDDVKQEGESMKDIHHFSTTDKNFVANCLALIKNEIYFINNQITFIIHKYSVKMHEEINPQYEMSFSDYRYMYEEIVNLIVMKYIRQCDETKKYFLRNKTNKFINTKKKDNLVDIDFMPILAYNSYLISETMGHDEYKLVEDLINKSIQKVTVYNHQVVHTEVKYYMNEANKKEIMINDYKIMFNTQMYSTLSNFMIHTNICKNSWFQNLIKMNELAEEKK